MIEPQLARPESFPRHVAIIMDGNGRWASERHKPRVWGHQKGVESVRSVVEGAVEMGLEHLTLYAFSEENWGRPEHEVKMIFQPAQLRKLRHNHVNVRRQLEQLRDEYLMRSTDAKPPSKTMEDGE